MKIILFQFFILYILFTSIYLYIFRSSSIKTIYYGFVYFVPEILLTLTLSYIILLYKKINIILMKKIHKIFLLFCILAIAIQLVSIYYSGNIITLLAIENIESINLILNKRFIIILITIVISLLLIYFYFPYTNKVSLKLCVILLICSLTCCFLQKTILSKNDYIRSPYLAYAFLLKEYFNLYKRKVDFSKVQCDKFLKKTVFTSNIENKFMIKNIEKPNIILFFIEGTSSIMFNDIQKKYPNLTPHLNRFIEQSLSFENYYNHTAATYRGIKEQLTSTYPKSGGFEWHNYNKNIKQDATISIAHILNNKNYDTIFFNPHSIETSGLDKMAEHLGFMNVYSSTDLSNKDLTDEDQFFAIEKYLKNKNDKKPFFICMYNIETHAFLNKKFNNQYDNNYVLAALHNYDKYFGKFIEYINQSRYSSNTIIIVTSDHAHYPEPPYLEIVDQGYQPYFVDKIPLFINLPFYNIPTKIDTHGRNSLAFAPTILHLLGINDVNNYFMGKSLFEEDNSPNISFLDDYYFINNNIIYPENNIPNQYKNKFERYKEDIISFHLFEEFNLKYKK